MQNNIQYKPQQTYAHILCDILHSLFDKNTCLCKRKLKAKSPCAWTNKHMNSKRTFNNNKDFCFVWNCQSVKPTNNAWHCLVLVKLSKSFRLVSEGQCTGPVTLSERPMAEWYRQMDQVKSVQFNNSLNRQFLVVTRGWQFILCHLKSHACTISYHISFLLYHDPHKWPQTCFTICLWFTHILQGYSTGTMTITWI